MHPVVGGGLLQPENEGKHHQCRWFQAAPLSRWVFEAQPVVGGWVAMISFLLLVNCLFRWSLLSHQSLKPDSHCDPLQLRKGIFLNYQPFLAPLRSLSTTPGGADGCVIWFHPQAKCLVCSHWRASLALPVQGEGRPWQATHVLCLQEKTLFSST